MKLGEVSLTAIALETKKLKSGMKAMVAGLAENRRFLPLARLMANFKKARKSKNAPATINITCN